MNLSGYFSSHFITEVFNPPHVLHGIFVVSIAHVHVSVLTCKQVIEEKFFAGTSSSHLALYLVKLKQTDRQTHIHVHSERIWYKKDWTYCACQFCFCATRFNCIVLLQKVQEKSVDGKVEVHIDNKFGNENFILWKNLKKITQRAREKHIGWSSALTDCNSQSFEFFDSSST